MSVEYTLDIQLTELGFPDILQTRETSTQRKTAQREALNPAQSLQGDRADESSERPPPQGDNTEKFDNDRAAAQEGSAEQDSGDSEVSDVYEEEEVDDDEDDEEEEETNNESNHSGNNRCSVCDLQLPSKFKLQDHMNLHTGARPYCCAECGKRFSQINNYRVHLRKHAQTKVDSFRCRVCLKVFASQEQLKQHFSITHFENEFYECDLCKRVFTSLRDCEHHVQLHKYMVNAKCQICGCDFPSKKALTRHQKKACRRAFKCTDCHMTFSKKNVLLKHSFTHLGLLPYTCVRCHCHFRLAKLYLQHKCEPQRIHCEACLREFLSQEEFQQHKKDTGCWGNQEPKVDEIRCLECGERFDTKEELKKHAGAHQRVLKCADCGKGFRSALLLMSHMGGHAGNSPCLCQSCGLGFPHQQNYDSHLKMCGKTPQPSTAHKKRQASKSSSPETKKFKAKPDSTNSTNTVTMPAVPDSAPPMSAAPIPAVPVSAGPMNDSSRPGHVTEDASDGSGSSDGLWKLTLDKQPPPGVKLVVFLPVCPSQTNGLTLPSAVSPTLPGSPMNVQPQHLGVNPALGSLLRPPLDLVTGIVQDPECEAPLDLSRKTNSSKPAPSYIHLLPPKSEPEDFVISGGADGTERQELKNGDIKAIIEAHPEEKDTIVKVFKTDPMEPPAPNVNATSGLILDMKEEPPSPGHDFDSCSSRSCQLTEREIKMEVDL